MGYTISRNTMICWDPHTKILKHCSSEYIDEHNNKYSKGWSQGSKLMLGTNISTVPTLKVDFSDNPFIKYDIFESNVNFHQEALPLAF